RPVGPPAGQGGPVAERAATARTATRGRHPSSSGTPLRLPARSGGAAPAGRDRPSRPAGRSPGARVARIGTRRGIAGLVGVLCVFGVVMVGSASPVISISLYGSPWGVLVRQLLWMGVGLSALLILTRVDYHCWQRLRGPLVVGTM